MLLECLLNSKIYPIKIKYFCRCYLSNVSSGILYLKSASFLKMHNCTDNKLFVCLHAKKKSYLKLSNKSRRNPISAPTQ